VWLETAVAGRWGPRGLAPPGLVGHRGLLSAAEGDDRSKRHTTAELAETRKPVARGSDMSVAPFAGRSLRPRPPGPAPDPAAAGKSMTRSPGESGDVELQQQRLAGGARRPGSSPL
jgi:hypothetical protein